MQVWLTCSQAVYCSGRGSFVQCVFSSNAALGLTFAYVSIFPYGHLSLPLLQDEQMPGTGGRMYIKYWLTAFEYEPRHEKTGFLHMRKQRRRSASHYKHSSCDFNNNNNVFIFRE